MERVTRLFYAFAAVLLLIGLALRVVPTRVGAISRPLLAAAKPASPTYPAAVQTPETEAAIIASNPFSISRSAPSVRYTPPDLSPATPDSARPRATRSAAAPRLLGTVVGPTGTAAIIETQSARDAGLYRVGDLVGGRRVREVAESTVVLQGATGRLVLRLRPGPPPHR